MKIFLAVKKLNSISRAWLNFRRRPVLCITLYRNHTSEQLWWHIWRTFPLNFFYAVFTEEVSLLILYHDEKKVKKWPKTQIKAGGPVRGGVVTIFTVCFGAPMATAVIGRTSANGDLTLQPSMRSWVRHIVRILQSIHSCIADPESVLYADFCRALVARRNSCRKIPGALT